jgi:DNA-binding response OmpR family regulator
VGVTKVHNRTAGRTRFLALVIEADEAYLAAIAACVRITGCHVQHVPDIEVGLRTLERSGFDVVVWGVPAETDSRNRSISELKLRTDSPLVLLASGFETAQQDLEAGADQWLPKPFVPGALVGAVRAVLRKSRSPVVPLASSVEIRGMALNGNDRSVTFKGAGATFTRQEWDLVSILVDHPNRYLTAADILRLGWHAGQYGPEEVRIYMRRLRRKIEPLYLPCGVLSKHGYGYCLMFT